MRTYKFFAGLVLLFLVLALTLKMKLFLGWAPDFLIGLLVAYGMSFGLYELIFFTGTAIWIMNWQPWPGPELWVITALAFVSFFGKFFMPWQRWVSAIILAGVGVFAVYAAGGPSLIPPNLHFLLVDAAVSALFALIIVRLFRMIFGKV